MYDEAVFDGLAAAIDEVEVPPAGDALVVVLALLDRLTAKVSEAVGEYDASGGWELDGATSAAAWLRYRGGMTMPAAASTVRTARRLRRLPVTKQAWLDGTLTGGQVHVVVANLDDRTAPLFAEQEAAVVPVLAPLRVHETATAMQRWRARAEALVDDGAGDTMPVRRLHVSRTLGGRFALDGDFDTEGGEVVHTAVRLAITNDGPDDPVRTLAQRRGDALVDVCRFFLDYQRHRRGGRHRPHLNVVVDVQMLTAGGPGEVVGGGPLDATTVRRLLCDAAVHRVVTDGRSTILDYGTTTRTVPANLWSALVLRDRHCRHDGCDRPPEWCEAHHVIPVSEGGPTSLDNLVLKCSRHHHLGHLPGWQEELAPDGTLVVTDPSGRTRVTHPPGLHLTPAPVAGPCDRLRPGGPRRERRPARRGTVLPASRPVPAAGAAPSARRPRRARARAPARAR